MRTRSGSATPFLFGEDLSPLASARQAAADLGRIAEEQQRQVLELAAFERGHAAGLEAARAEAAQLRVAALGRIATEAGLAIAEIDRRSAEIEEEALDFFGALACTLAGRALAQERLAGIAEAAREAFRHLRNVPHLVARVHASLVEDADEALRAMAREHGFEGRIVVIGSEEIPPGDARLDWADGAVLVDRRAREEAVAALLSRAGFDGRTGEGL